MIIFEILGFIWTIFAALLLILGITLILITIFEKKITSEKTGTGILALIVSIIMFSIVFNY